MEIIVVNLSGLANSIGDTIKGIGSALGILPAGKDPYPHNKITDLVTSEKNPEAWNKLPFPYTFSVVQLKNSGFDSPFKDFALPLAPSQITQTEDFALSIKATQGGTVTSHSGNRYKTLVISGTTGVNPFRGISGVDATTGKALIKPDELKFKSGYEVFQDLRNWFRAYYEYKKVYASDEAVNNSRLVFKNFKDGEFLIVELLKFTMKRTGERSLLYDYEMEFKVLSHFKFKEIDKDIFAKIDSLINKVISKIAVARGIFLSVTEIMRNIASTYDALVLEPLRKISLLLKAIANIPIVFADLKKRIVKDTITALGALRIMKTIRDQQNASKTGSSSSIPPRIQKAKLPKDIPAAVKSRGVEAIYDLKAVTLDIPASLAPQATSVATAQEIKELLKSPRSFFEQTRETLKEFKANAEDLFNLGSPAYDTLFDRTSTQKADSAKEVTNDEFDVLFALNESITAVNQLLSTDVLFKSNFKDRMSSITKSFVDNLSTQALPSVKQITLPTGVDLEQLALDHLGDPTRWVEIAELNDLRAPYIVQDLTSTLSNVLKPGSTLLLPQPIVFGTSKIPKTKKIPALDGLNEVEKSLGVDLKVDANFDLALGNNGDLVVTSGTANMAQAIVLRIQYERGELKKDPQLGVGVQVGSKFLTLEAVRDNLLTTLSLDNRIESVTDVSLLRDGPALFMQFKVNIKRVDAPIPLTIRL